MIPIAHDDSSARVAMRPTCILRDFLLDVILWYCIPTAFLFAYVGHYEKPFAAIAPHLRLLTLPLAGLLLARLIVARLRIAAIPARVMTTFATGTLLTLLITYYLLVLVGL